MTSVYLNLCTTVKECNHFSYREAIMLKQLDSEYAGYRQAGIRLRENLVSALQADRTERLLYTFSAVHAFDKAHLVTLAKEGTVPLRDCVEMLQALRGMEEEGVLAARLRVHGGAHSGEQYLIRELGEAIGGQMNLGRSSGDIGEVARRMTVRVYLLQVMRGLNSVRGTFLRLAEAQVNTPMPGYTHGEIAQPTTLGHWASMWDRVLARDFRRCIELYARNNQSPAGAAIMTGTDFELDRELTGVLLGFDKPIAHTMDAILSPDNTLEFANVLALTATDLARLADDLMTRSSSESGFFDIPDRYCGTSSIMAQKKNPVWPESTKALACQCVGVLTEVFVSARGASGLSLHELGNADVRLWEVASLLSARLRECADLIENLQVNAPRMLDSLHNSWATATDLAGMIVRRAGFSWRSAHQIVGIVVRLCEDREIAPSSIASSMIDDASLQYFDAPANLTDDEVRLSMDPLQFVNRRRHLGGPAPRAHTKQLASFGIELAMDTQVLASLCAAAEAADRKLEESIDGLGVRRS